MSSTKKMTTFFGPPHARGEDRVRAQNAVVKVRKGNFIESVEANQQVSF
jgi:hypothetical protein